MGEAADRAAIERAVELYVEGARTGDAAKLREAFHESAWMFGSLGGQRVDMPIGEMIKMSETHPADVDGTYRAEIISVEQVGDAATAVLEEEGFWGTLSFTDFFALAHGDGGWKIVNKTFAHTDGEPPAM